VSDTGANIAALLPSQIADIATEGVDTLDASFNLMWMSVEQAQALGPVAVSDDDNANILDAGANISALTAAEIGDLADLGFDILDARDNTLTLSADQVRALGSMTVAGNDVAILTDTGANIVGMSIAEITALSGQGIDGLDATTNFMSMSLAKFEAASGLNFDASDLVRVNGTNGADDFRALSIGTNMFGFEGNDRLIGAQGVDLLVGGDGNDVFFGAAGHDRLFGNQGFDIMIGGDGNDWLDGQLGKDTYRGGAGADTFVFAARGHVANNFTNRDVVWDFGRGGDKVHLAGIDAVNGAGNQAFDFIGLAAFSGTAGELRYFTTSNGAVVTGDWNGDGRGDFQIYLDAVTSLNATDFIL